MIRLQDLTPDVYYKQSRDFQLIGRLYDLVLNYTKTNTTLVNHVRLSDNTDTQLIDLLATTLGFKAAHTYNVKQLVSVCSCLSEILKNKGTKKAIELAVYAILNAEGIFLTEQVNLNDLVQISYQTDDAINPKPIRELKIVIPAQMQDTTLLRDLLDYILPAGFSARFIRSAVKYMPGSTDNFNAADTVTPSLSGTGFMSRAAKTEVEPAEYDRRYDDVNPGHIVGNFINSAV